MAPAVLLAIGGAVLAFAAPISSGWVERAAGAAVLALGSVSLLALTALWRSPRLAYQDEPLLVYLQNLEPIRVPIEIVECFFLGQAPSLVGRDREKSENKTVVVRLAEAASQWRHRDVWVRWGHWCDGYITIRGAWCEPISSEVMERLNTRLLEAHRAQKRQRAEQAEQEASV